VRTHNSVAICVQDKTTSTNALHNPATHDRDHQTIHWVRKLNVTHKNTRKCAYLGPFSSKVRTSDSPSVLMRALRALQHDQNFRHPTVRHHRRFSRRRTAGDVQERRIEGTAAEIESMDVRCLQYMIKNPRTLWVQLRRWKKIN